MVTLGVLFLLFTAWLGSSRTGYVSFGIATIFSSLYWFSGQWRGAALGALIAICLLYISPTANQRVNQAITELSMGIADGGYSSSGSIRAVMWQNSLQIIGNNWILGTGAGGFQEEYAKTVEGVRGWRATITDDPHNQFLHIWAEYGIFGLAFFILFLVAVGCRARLSETFGLIALVTLLISCTAGTFNGVFGSSIEGRILFFTFAICLSALTNRRTIKRGSPISF